MSGDTLDIRPRDGRGSGENRLFRYDSRIAINLAQATFATWHDRLIACAMLVAALAGLHAALGGRPWTSAAWLVFTAGALAGIAVSRGLAARLRFHAFDGLLAADAMLPAKRARYRLTWHVLSISASMIAALIARPSTSYVLLLGYLAGALIVQIAGKLVLPAVPFRRTSIGRRGLAWSRRPAAGLAAAVMLLLALALASRAMNSVALIAVAGIVSTTLLLALTAIDNRAVEFMKLAGHRPWRIVGFHAGSSLLFAAIALPLCWLCLGAMPCAAVAAASAGTLFLLALRLFAYQLHRKRFAEALVSILIALLVLVTFALPPAAPFVAAAMIWHLQRRALTQTWMLA